MQIKIKTTKKNVLLPTAKPNDANNKKNKKLH